MCGVLDELYIKVDTRIELINNRFYCPKRFSHPTQQVCYLKWLYVSNSFSFLQIRGIFCIIP